MVNASMASHGEKKTIFISSEFVSGKESAAEERKGMRQWATI